MMKYVAVLSACLLAAACSNSSPNPMPSVAAKGKWHSIGKIQEGNIEAAYDTGNIVRRGGTVQLTDRKVVLDPAKMHYTDTPAYKAVITDWEFQCTQRMYRPLLTRFLDNEGRILLQQRYEGHVRPAAVTPNTPAAALYNAACTAS